MSIKILKWTGIALLVLLSLLCLFISTNQNKKFNAPYPTLQATNDSAVIARGKHLVFGPAHCADCHSSPETHKQVTRGEVVPLSGGKFFDLPIGKVFSRNLTPHETGIGKWSDTEIARALRYGVAADNRALFDIMPFHNMSDEDLVAIISYLRQQEPIKNKVPENALNFLGKAVSAFLLKPVGPSYDFPSFPKKDTTAVYGEYLANSVANCRGCHTNRNLMTGEFIGEEYAGGLTMETVTDAGIYFVTSPNITTDATGRLNKLTLKEFIARFRVGTIIPQSHMPWGPFSRMKDDELKAIYNFLQTVKPVHSEIKETIVLKEYVQTVN
jgi:mono/diheme cytochrome c family protein